MYICVPWPNGSFGWTDTCHSNMFMLVGSLSCNKVDSSIVSTQTHIKEGPSLLMLRATNRFRAISPTAISRAEKHYQCDSLPSGPYKSQWSGTSKAIFLYHDVLISFVVLMPITNSEKHSLLTDCSLSDACDGGGLIAHSLSGDLSHGCARWVGYLLKGARDYYS